jgi:hypothetical protein
MLLLNNVIFFSIPPVCIDGKLSYQEFLVSHFTLNEKPLNPVVVVDLIHLRKASMLEDGEVAEILNEISRRNVREKGKTIAAYI